jgi:MFS family permease
VTSSRWFILGILFLVRIAMGFQFQSVASTAPFLISDLGFSYTEIGTLIGLYMLPGVFVALPGGMLGTRFDDKRVCAAGLILMVMGGVTTAYSTSDDAAACGRVVSGAGAVLFSLVITKMVTDWFAGREIVTAMGAMLASWPFGIALALLTQAPIATQFGWPAVMTATALLCAAALVMILAFYRKPDTSPTASRPTARTETAGKGLSSSEALSAGTVGLMWGIFNVGLVIFSTFTPALLTERGLSLVEAGGITSLGLWVSMLSLPMGGYTVERIGRPHAAIVLFSLVAGLALALLIELPPVVLCLALGIAIGPPAGAIMALPAEVLHPNRRALGLGVFYTIYYVAMTTGPAMAGFLRDDWGSATAAIIFGALLFWLIAPLLLVFRLFSVTARSALYP